MREMRLVLWHGWLLEGTGSNVYTAKVAEVLRQQGHEVVVVCQDPRPERLPFVDEVGRAGPDGIGDLSMTEASPGRGRVTVVRPEIGPLLPVFVLDHYERFEVKRFVDLDDRELERYLDLNVSALRGIARDFSPDAAVAGHAVPGPVVARRALGDGAYVAKVHGSDLEYAVRLQERYAELAREGLEAARSVVGGSRDVLARARRVAAIPEERIRIVPPGVDVERWRPRGRREALMDAASRLASDSDAGRGRPNSADREVAARLHERDAAGLDALAKSYEQGASDPDAVDRLRGLSGVEGPVVGYLGKFIPEKGVERFLEALVLLGPKVRGLVVGFGSFREWLVALLVALDAGDVDAYRWLAESSPMRLELGPEEVKAAAGLASRVTFTGRLDHRFAPETVAAMDALVVPSTLEEAFGMVAAEGAAAGALPVVARHSSLAEVAESLENAIGRPGALSFEPGKGATARLAERVAALLAEPDRAELARAARAHVLGEWTWERTVERLLAAAV
jgi:glycosyltransferase involved in cell wall biosynthesis